MNGIKIRNNTTSGGRDFNRVLFDFGIEISNGNLHSMLIFRIVNFDEIGNLSFSVEISRSLNTDPIFSVFDV
jgi:hypothetical protein